jgi:hypothetical protein
LHVEDYRAKPIPQIQNLDHFKQILQITQTRNFFTVETVFLSRC